MEERWLIFDDILKYLNVSNKTVYKWVNKGAMTAHRVERC